MLQLSRVYSIENIVITFIVIFDGLVIANIFSGEAIKVCLPLGTFFNF